MERGDQHWRGRPLTSHEVVVNLIGATSIKGGLKVHAHRDTGHYPQGVKVTNAELAAVALTRHDFHGDWNSSVHPRPPLTADSRSCNYDHVILRGNPNSSTPETIVDARLVAIER